MLPVPPTLRFFVAAGAAVVLVGCSSTDSGGPSAADSAEPSSEPTSATGDPAAHYLDSVNALCEQLLPKVVAATRGGSIDVPAKEWVATWPAHKALLDHFDTDLAAIPVPAEAAGPARVMADYVVWATGYDERRIAAATKGEAAWQAEIVAEADILDDPTLRSLGAAGFDDSCQAR